MRHLKRCAMLFCYAWTVFSMALVVVIAGDYFFNMEVSAVFESIKFPNFIQFVSAFTAAMSCIAAFKSAEAIRKSAEAARQSADATELVSVYQFVPFKMEVITALSETLAMLNKKLCPVGFDTRRPETLVVSEAELETLATQRSVVFKCSVYYGDAFKKRIEAFYARLLEALQTQATPCDLVDAIGENIALERQEEYLGIRQALAEEAQRFLSEAQGLLYRKR